MGQAVVIGVHIHRIGALPDLLTVQQAVSVAVAVVGAAVKGHLGMVREHIAVRINVASPTSTLE